jgi:hypothetical protein
MILIRFVPEMCEEVLGTGVTPFGSIFPPRAMCSRIRYIVSRILVRLYPNNEHTYSIRWYMYHDNGYLVLVS